MILKTKRGGAGEQFLGNNRTYHNWSQTSAANEKLQYHCQVQFKAAKFHLKKTAVTRSGSLLRASICLLISLLSRAETSVCLTTRKSALYKLANLSRDAGTVAPFTMDLP